MLATAMQEETHSGRRSKKGDTERTRHGFLKKYFQRAAIGLLCDKSIEAPMGFYLYAAPLSARDPVRGCELWAQAAAHPGYTLLRQEEELLLDSRTAEWARGMLPYKATVMDMASGDSDKGLYLLGHMDEPAGYIAIDQTEDFARETANRVKLARPDLETGFLVHDIIYGGVPNVSGNIRNPVMTLFGGLLTNNSWPLKAYAEDEHRLAAVMADIARVFGSQFPFFFNRSGKIVTTWQISDSEGETPESFKESIETAYNTNPAFAQFVLNGLKLIRSDLKVKGLDCDAFDFEAVWKPEQMRICCNAISRKEQDFTIEGTPGHLDAGESVTLLNSFKFSRPAIAEIYNAACFSQVDFFTIPGNQVALVVIDVPPIGYAHSRTVISDQQHHIDAGSYGNNGDALHLVAPRQANLGGRVKAFLSQATRMPDPLPA